MHAYTWTPYLHDVVRRLQTKTKTNEMNAMIYLKLETVPPLYPVQFDAIVKSGYGSCMNGLDIRDASAERSVF